jgi:hypothetical protein
MGCNFTCDRAVIASLLPPGQDSELMGLYLFAGQVLNWLPPLLYTTLNELGYSPNAGVAMLNIFFLMGIVGFMAVGNYQDAVAAAKTAPRYYDSLLSRNDTTTTSNDNTNNNSNTSNNSNSTSNQQQQ